MPYNTKHHPIFNPNNARGTTQPLSLQTLREEATQPLARPYAIYPVYSSHHLEYHVGEDGWIGKDALRLFTTPERNYAWSQFYAGYRTIPLPPMIQDFVVSCLVLAHSHQGPDEPLLYRVQRDYPHQQVWVCLDMFGKHFLATPQDMLSTYLAWAKTMRLARK